MEATRPSLLLLAQTGDATSWEQMVAIYEPLIRGNLRRYGITPPDDDDLTQDVLATVSHELHRFQHAGRTGSFRSWLRTITVNRAREFWRAGRLRMGPGDGGYCPSFLDQLEDPESSLSRQWDAEHDQYVCRQLLQVLERDFAPKTVQAFRRLVFDGASGSEVAEELGMTRAAVFTAQSRVLKRLREVAQGLLDD